MNKRFHIFLMPSKDSSVAYFTNCRSNNIMLVKDMKKMKQNKQDEI